MTRALVLGLCACLLPLAGAEVLTQHNDNARTGANLAETALTPATVNAATFGKRFTLPLNANVNGQVLYAAGLTIGGRERNVVFAFTSVAKDASPCALYAFDADAEGPPLWERALPPSAPDTTDTPAIDRAAGTMYFVSKDKNVDGANWLHAVDILTGAERAGSPVQVTGTLPGDSVGGKDGQLAFPAGRANCRPGVLVEKGLVYVAFGFGSDRHPYHGWVFCYAYDGKEFTRKAMLCTTPDKDAGTPPNFSRDGGGIWQGGKGLATDGEAIYCMTGNGNLSADSGGRNYAMCFLKLRLGDLQILDWFAGASARKDSDADNDLNNVGPLIIPGTGVLFAGATKAGRNYLVDTAKMGHLDEEKDACLQSFTVKIPPFPNGQNPVAWQAGAAGTFIYVWNYTQAVAQYRYDPQARQIVGGAPVHVGGFANGGGGGLAITANGTADGILWCVGLDGVVHALDATDVSKELWSSAQDAARDALGSTGKWQFPTVVNGKAYIPSGKGQLVVYGLLKP
jgi:hypothetical protein